MNMKNNSLYKETEERFENALINLLQQHEPSRISINMLCNESGLHRSTFYVHYGSIYDLFTKLGERIKNELFYSFDVCSTDEYTIEKFTNLLLSFQKNSKIYKSIFVSCQTRTDSDEHYPNLRHSLIEKGYDESSAKYICLFWRKGIMSVITEWLNKDCCDEVYQIAEVLYKLSYTLFDTL